MGHAFGEVNRARWRGKADDPSGAKRRRAFRRATHLKNRDIADRLQSQAFDQHPGSDIRGAANAADADAFPFQILRRLDRLLDD
jgi:hypothetical protein